MTDSVYLTGRKKYAAPQAMLWSDNPGTFSNGFYYPDGYEEGQNQSGLTYDFIICSDHNRTELQFSSDRIQNRQRMINGNMRAYTISDKLTLSTSWMMLPSRSFKYLPNFDDHGNRVLVSESDQYTVDGGAGGLQLLNWYQTHTGPFWVFLAYDQYSDKTKYGQIIQMYFKDFSYTVIKRNANELYDLWNISVTLEEV